MMARSLARLASFTAPLVLALAACAPEAHLPPPRILPAPPPAPLTELDAPPPIAPTGVLARPAPTGDHEMDALQLGFWGCRVMGTRIQPTMSGKALLHAHLGPGGEVLDVSPVLVEALPRTVVSCLVERVWNARFDPRGGYGSLLVIPVDFTRAPAAPEPAPKPARVQPGAPGTQEL